MKKLIAGMLVGATLTSGMAFAKNGTEVIEALYNNIKIYVDGVKIDPKDANGNAVEPFIYNGTTYLPVRAVGEAIGKPVTWDGTTYSVYLGEKPGEKPYWTDICPPYEASYVETYDSSSGKYVTIGGVKYTNCFRLGRAGFGNDSSAKFNLNGKYNKLYFEIGTLDGGYNDGTLNIFLDGKLAKTVEIDGEALPQAVSLDLNGALQMKLELLSDYTLYGIINAIIE